MKTHKRILSIFLALALACGLLALTSVTVQAAVRPVNSEATLHSAIAAAAVGVIGNPDATPPIADTRDIIQLTGSFACSSAIVIDGKNIILDLNGFTLSANFGVDVRNGSLLLADPGDGAFNVSGQTGGNAVFAFKAQVQVTSVNTSNAARAVTAGTGGVITVFGNVTNSSESDIGVRANDGGKVIVEGAITVGAKGTYLDVAMTPRTQEQFSFNALYPGYQTYKSDTSIVLVRHAPHVFGDAWVGDDDDHWVECICGEKDEVTPHTLEADLAFDETGHWNTCEECDTKISFAAHDFAAAWETDDDSHWHECACGAVSGFAAHAAGATWLYDDDDHWKECECGVVFGLAAHTPSDWLVEVKPTAVTAGSRFKVCTACGFVTESESIPATGTGGGSSGGDYIIKKYVGQLGCYTTYESSFWNWFKYIVLFGWIWMWFI